jgi:hypothetical protein
LAGLDNQLDNQTTEKYIGLLEKAFIVFRLGSLFIATTRRFPEIPGMIYIWLQYG